MPRLDTFHDMFKKRFPKRYKRVRSYTQLVQNFGEWTGRQITDNQMRALAEEANAMNLPLEAKSRSLLGYK